jgi:type IX secretion system PorP/SprF family membrane protein
MRYLGIVLILFLSFVEQINAQQIPLYSQHTFNRYGFNPAYAGIKNRVEGTLTHRNHLLNFPGAPTTQIITVTTPWQKKYMGFGLRVLNDNIGATNSFSINGGANYFINLGEGKLSMGLELGIDQYGVDWTTLVKNDNNDAVIPGARSSAITPNGAFGLFYTTEKWYAGYSVQNLIASRFKSEEREFTYSTHHFINTGMAVELNEKFQLEPHLLLKATRPTIWQMDLGAYVVYDMKYGAGITYRTGDAIVFTAKVELREQFYFGYSYETRINSLAVYSNTSHEIMLGYYFNLLEPARKKSIHPRYYF